MESEHSPSPGSAAEPETPTPVVSSRPSNPSPSGSSGRGRQEKKDRLTSLFNEGFAAAQEAETAEDEGLLQRAMGLQLRAIECFQKAAELDNRPQAQQLIHNQINKMRVRVGRLQVQLASRQLTRLAGPHGPLGQPQRVASEQPPPPAAVPADSPSCSPLQQALQETEHAIQEVARLDTGLMALLRAARPRARSRTSSPALPPPVLESKRDQTNSGEEGSDSDNPCPPVLETTADGITVASAQEKICPAWFTETDYQQLLRKLHTTAECAFRAYEIALNTREIGLPADLKLKIGVLLQRAREVQEERDEAAQLQGEVSQDI